MRRVIGFATMAVAASTVTFVVLLRENFVSSPTAANFLTLGLASTTLAITVAVVGARRGVGGVTPDRLALAATGAALAQWRFLGHGRTATVGAIAWFLAALLPLEVAQAHFTGVTPTARRALRWAQPIVAALGVAAVIMARTSGLPGWFSARTPTVDTHAAFGVSASTRVSSVLVVSWAFAASVVAVLALAGVYMAWRRYPVQGRRAELPALVGVSTWAIVIPAVALGAVFTEHSASGGTRAVGNLIVATFPSMAMAALAATVGWVAIVRPRLGRTAGGQLELRHAPARGDLDDWIADLLGDPAIVVAYESEAGLVDRNGLPVTQSNRVQTRFMRDGELVAVVLHQPGTPSDSVAMAGHLLGATLDAERAAALAAARAESIRVVAARRLQTGDVASRAVMRSIGEGPRRDLELLVAELRANGAPATSTSTRLQSIAAAVRELSHGLIPPALDEDGLAAVLPGSRLDVNGRLPRAVEVTVYRIVTEDRGACVRADARGVTVTLSQPLSSEVMDRVVLLDGEVSEHSVLIPVGA